jgi:hypothetical protein
MKNQQILSFRREVDKNCALLSFYAASSGKFLQTLREDQRFYFQESRTRILDSLKMVSIGRPETSVRNYRYLLHKDSESCSSVLKIGGIFRCRNAVISVKIYLQFL